MIGRPSAQAIVAVQNPVRCARVDVDALAAWMPQLVGRLAPDAGSVTVRLVGDDEMQRLNRTFRGLDKTTDVLSFPCGEQLDEGIHVGDIALSVPVARRQAGDLGHSLLRELKTLALHGLLHCLGYDHEVDDGAMEDLERELRQSWIEDAD